jgi:hypothetical protein
MRSASGFASWRITVSTESDRDDLARIAYRGEEGAWEHHVALAKQVPDSISADIVKDVMAFVDAVLAAGWRKVGEDQVVVRRTTTKMCQAVLQVAAKSRASYMRDQVTNALDDVTAALADPAGANGGE